jgi:hypothetical protein
MTENPKEEVEGKENGATQPEPQSNAVTGSTDLLKNKCRCSARRRPKTESGEEIHISNCPEYPQEVKVMAESPHDTQLGVAAEATKPQPKRTAETVSKAPLRNIGRCICQAHRRRRMESGAERHFNYCPAYFKVSENSKKKVEGKENEATQPEPQSNAVTGSTAPLKTKCKCSARRRPKTESGEEIHISNCPAYPKVSDYPQEDVE